MVIDNGKVPGLKSIAASPRDEMAALDQLGPLSRAALQNATLSWSAIIALAFIHRASDLSPQHPLADSFLRDCILNTDAAAVADKLRSI